MVFDVNAKMLHQLRDDQSEELIALLAEAEVQSEGHSLACVIRSSGDVNAPDGGVDTRVEIPVNSFNSDFLKRSNTIFQTKKPVMPPAQITKEMRPGGILRPAISRQAEIGGSYIIVSLEDGCSETQKGKRIEAMQKAMEKDPNKDLIHLDFYNQDRLLQWLKKHPAVINEFRNMIGQPLSEWRGYGSWSNPPINSKDTLIMASGVSVILPAEKHRELTIEEAIEPMRELVRSSSEAIRITGLSGVGKTRIVQALFDGTVGTEPLNPDSAVYADVGAGPNPPAGAMLEKLIARNQAEILVLDNCPSELHFTLAERVTSSNTNAKLISIEYDIRTDNPRMTKVIHIKTNGPEVAEQLLRRRHYAIGIANARKIAEFARGNAAISLAVAQQVKDDESLSHLSDGNLFDRLFWQRNQVDNELREHAQVLSLIYSYSVDEKDGINELKILGSFYNIEQSKLFRSTATLLERGICQKRGDMRAILPQAIADRLACEALERIQINKLHSVFKTHGRERLLASFAHRLGFMHNHRKAQKIVKTWLQKDNLFGKILNLDENSAMCLEYIASVAPEAVLARIENEINSPEFSGIGSILGPCQLALLRLLALFAYESSIFERCVNLLLRIIDFEDPSNGHSLARDSIIRFFQPYGSGTHASLDQRIAVLRNAIWSEQQDFGLEMLSHALSPEPGFGDFIHEFGARPRDFGWEPNPQELVEWFSRFIDVAVEAGLNDAQELASGARSVFARAFMGLWLHHDEMRGKLVKATRDIHAKQPWLEGWRVVGMTASLCKGESIDEDLAKLQMELAPKDLTSKIKVYITGDLDDLPVLDDQFDDKDAKGFQEARQRAESKARELGKQFVSAGASISSLGKDLFSTLHKPFRRAFGEGLAMGASNRREVWHELVAALHNHVENQFDVSVLKGFICQTNIDDRPLAQKLLDQCPKDRLLCKVLVGLHPLKSFDRNDLERCMIALEVPEVGAGMFSCFFYRDEFNKLPQEKLIDLAGRILSKPYGDDVLLDALSRRFLRKGNSEDPLGDDFRRIGLEAARTRLLRSQSGHGNYGGEITAMKGTIESAFAFPGNDEYKMAWLDAVFTVLNWEIGSLHDFRTSICVAASKMPEEFLDRVLALEKGARHKWEIFVRYNLKDQRLFFGADIVQIIGWCKRRNKFGAWELVAECVHLWCLDKENDSFSLSNDAVRLLEAAPEPETVLRIYADRIKLGVMPEGTMEKRTAAFIPLFEMEGNISSVARDICDKMSRSINAERENMRRWLDEREQRFE